MERLEDELWRMGLRGTGVDMSIEPCGGKRDDGLTRGQKHVLPVVLQKAFKYSKMRGEARK